MMADHDWITTRAHDIFEPDQTLRAQVCANCGAKRLTLTPAGGGETQPYAFDPDPLPANCPERPIMEGME